MVSMVVAELKADVMQVEIIKVQLISIFKIKAAPVFLFAGAAAEVRNMKVRKSEHLYFAVFLFFCQWFKINFPNQAANRHKLHQDKSKQDNPQDHLMPYLLITCPNSRTEYPDSVR
jgi:hypothetical protein